MSTSASVWRSEDNFWVSILSFHGGIQGSNSDFRVCMANVEPYHSPPPREMTAHLSLQRKGSSCPFGGLCAEFQAACAAGTEALKRVRGKCSTSGRRLGKGVRTDVRRYTEARSSRAQQEQ